MREPYRRIEIRKRRRHWQYHLRVSLGLVGIMVQDWTGRFATPEDAIHAATMLAIRLEAVQR